MTQLAPERPVRETIGGIAYEDPYAWLEDDSPETLAWQRQQDAKAAALLHAAPGFAALVAAAADAQRDRRAAPRRRGAHWFVLRRTPAGTRLIAARAPCSQGTVLVDVAALDDKRGPASLDWFFPSPDGSRVAYGISHGGDEQSVLHVVETDSGRVLEDRIPYMTMGNVSWLPDSSGFYCNPASATAFEDPVKHILFHRLGQGALSEPEPVSLRTEHWIIPQVSHDGRWVAACSTQVYPAPEWVKALPDGEWRPFLQNMEGASFIGVFDGEDYVAITTHEAPCGRLVRIPIATGADPSTWTELLPQSDVVLRTLTRVGDALVLSQHRDAVAELRVLELDGSLRTEVELPGRGAMMPASGAHTHPLDVDGDVVPCSDGVSFVFSTPTRSPAVYHYEVATETLHELAPPRVVREDLVVEQLQATAADGAPVGFHLVRRADADPQTPRPALIHVYGGWNIPLVPAWIGHFAPFVDAGGLLVLGHVRGGGEHGERFWEDGMLGAKQHGFDDLYAIAEELIADGRTTAAQLAFFGGSNGSLHAGAAINQRPELFAAVVSLVPMTDMMKVLDDPFLAGCVVEYGDPSNPRDAQWLYAYSPYHNVRPAAHPATLVCTAANDMRCPPWHARKHVARLQATNRGERPVLLRVWPDSGHAAALGSPEYVAEWLGFAMEHVGLEPVTAG